MTLKKIHFIFNPKRMDNESKLSHHITFVILLTGHIHRDVFKEFVCWAQDVWLKWASYKYTTIRFYIHLTNVT